MPHDDDAEIVRELIRLLPLEERRTLLVCSCIASRSMAIESARYMLAEVKVLTIGLSVAERFRLAECARDLADELEREAFEELV